MLKFHIKSINMVKEELAFRLLTGTEICSVSLALPTIIHQKDWAKQQSFSTFFKRISLKYVSEKLYTVGVMEQGAAVRLRRVAGAPAHLQLLS